MSKATIKPALRPGEFVPLVALLMALVALAIDAILPALPAIGHDLGAPRRNDVQFVVTAVLLGLGLGQIVFGPLSDGIGRKPSIHAGLVLFMSGCVMSIFAHTFEVMIAGRILQGIGIAGPRIVTVALVRDQYEGRQMARLMSFAMAVFILVPTVAPSLGLGILWLGGWRAIFATFFIIAAVTLAWFSLRQPETLPPARRRPLSPRAVGGAALEALRIRAALGYTVATGCVFAPFVAYLSSSQQIFQEAYGTGVLFPVYFGMLALAFGGASLVNGWLVMKYGMRRLSRMATVSLTLVSAVSWTLAFAFGGLPPFWLFMTCLLVIFLCIGLLFGNLNALAMEPLGHIAGVGAGVVASLSTFISVPFGALVGHSFDGTIYALMAAFGVFGAGTYAAMRWAEGGGEKRSRDAAARP
ncbi:MAG: multidrug effflux MFS transporter [Nitrospinae bacterium]|nr:multidrug effflux MFS transporter [Nitrospinota bacterium]